MLKLLRLVAIVLAVLAVLLALAFAVVPGQVESAQNQTVDHEPYSIDVAVQQLHDELRIGDLHADTFLWSRDPLERSARGHVDLPRLRDGNVALQVFAAVTKSPSGQNYVENDADSDRITLLAVAQRWPRATWSSLLERALYQAERVQKISLSHPDELQLLRTRTDLDDLLARRAAGESVVGAVLATEGAHPLEADLENLDCLYDAGYRMVGMQHFFDNALGGSLHGTSKAGITPFGRRVVEALDEREIIIDVAHSSAAMVADVLNTTTRPVVVSHTGMQGHCDSPRNLPDHLMWRIAERGGLIGIGFWEGAVCDASPRAVVRAIRHAIQTVGPTQVALGSDFDGAVTVGFDASELAALTQEMVRQRMSEDEIRGVMGENMIRFLSENLPEG